MSTQANLTNPLGESHDPEGEGSDPVLGNPRGEQAEKPPSPPLAGAEDPQSHELILYELEAYVRRNAPDLEQRRIWEFGAVNLRGTFSFSKTLYVDPGDPLHPHDPSCEPWNGAAQRGIEVDDQTLPSFSQVWRRFQSLLLIHFPGSKIIMVSHRGTEHAEVILQQELEGAGLLGSASQLLFLSINGQDLSQEHQDHVGLPHAAGQGALSNAAAFSRIIGAKRAAKGITEEGFCRIAVENSRPLPLKSAPVIPEVLPLVTGMNSLSMTPQPEQPPATEQPTPTPVGRGKETPSGTQQPAARHELIIYDLEAYAPQNQMDNPRREFHHIWEFAATNMSGTFRFSRVLYVDPQDPLHPQAPSNYPWTSATSRGLELDDPTLPRFSQVWQLFRAQLSRRFPDSEILLIAHNAERHDEPILCRELERSGLLGTASQLRFLDSWTFLTLGAQGSLALLHQQFTGAPHADGHIALADAEALSRLLCAELGRRGGTYHQFLQEAARASRPLAPSTSGGSPAATPSAPQTPPSTSRTSSSSSSSSSPSLSSASLNFSPPSPKPSPPGGFQTVPYCPDHRIPMEKKWPRHGGRPFYGCPRFWDYDCRQTASCNK